MKTRAVDKRIDLRFKSVEQQKLVAVCSTCVVEEWGEAQRGIFLHGIDNIQVFLQVSAIWVEYNVVDGKPYVAALNGKEDDPEMGMFWFVYLKTLSSDKDPKIVEESPVDIKLQPNQEIILWYKRGPWSHA
ncbi:hypothetical protein AVEN_76818-1 [Araneus ventricosus]|uniref:Uncharacterized protein n=1 Tax=Araneus ventricosus TaxID=182803 RepID=A0A4Y2HZU0_ARAVE|nr:hypothetical protein AVEN_76818-1 [Araneus ventricosus]